MINFGEVPAGAVLPIPFAAYAAATGASVTLTGLAVTDIEVYKGTSMTQRSSDNGYALIDTDGIDIDGITGIHGFSIDTGDNSDASFYTVGSYFSVIVSAVTIDGQTVNFIAATFRLKAAESVAGYPKADTSHFGGTAGTFSGGRPEVNTTHVGGTVQTARDIGASVLLSTGTGTGQLDFTSGVVKANTTQWLGGTIPAVSVTGVPLVDLKYVLGTISPATAGSVRADAVTGAVGSVTGAVGSVTGAVGSVTGAVGSVTARVTANTDQLAGQTVTAAAGVTFPASVASPTNITAGTITTVTNLTNAPTAGDLTATMKASVTTAATAATPTAAAVTGAVGSVTGNVGGSVVGSVGSVTAGVTVATNNDKTGYALTALESLITHSGTAQAGGSNSITLAAGASATDGLHVGNLIKIYGGTGAGQTRTISAYIGATKVATVGRAWAITPDSSSTYAVEAIQSPLLDSNLYVIASSVQGNVSGSVGSVTGNVGGSVASVVGLTASNLDATVSSRSTYAGGAVASVTAGVTVTTNNDKTGYGLSAAAVQAVWDALTTALTTAGSIGKRLADYITGDAYARIGAGGAGLTALGDTRLANLDAAISSVAGLNAAGVRSAIGLASANLDTQIASLATAANLAVVAGYVDTEVAAIKAKTDNLPASPAATGDIPTATQNADALLNRDMSAVSDTNARSPLNALRFIRNKWAIASGTLTVKKEDDSTTAWTAVVSSNPAADPITGTDPG